MTIAERLDFTGIPNAKAEKKAPEAEGRSLPTPTGPAWRRLARADARAQTWVQITLVIVVGALLLYMMSIPKLRSSRALLSEERELVELQLTLEELRAVIADYHADHGAFPGRAPDGKTDPNWFERQLVLATNKAGEAAAERIQSHPLGPYEPRGVPENPVNGLSTVRFLAADETWPNEADGRAGWIYRPSTGEIRADCLGTAFGSGQRYYDL